MPKENRSSNTEMVSVPEVYMLVERSIWTEQQVEAATACITRLKGVPTMTDRALAMAAIDAAQCTAPDIALSDLVQNPQPHPEPIAWMVGTAIWWTKEEAERDASEVGQPVVCLGPMADSGEVERLRAVIEQQKNLIASLRNELVESRSIDASAETSVPAALIPEGYCIMPRRLTAENGAKALLLGEFKLEVTRECPECRELEEPAEGCEICDGEGEYGQSHMIPWEKIKFIYSEAVKGLALQSNTAR
jgi:hypothetical protein